MAGPRGRVQFRTTPPGALGATWQYVASGLPPSQGFGGLAGALAEAVRPDDPWYGVAMDPLAGTPWSAPTTVDGFARGDPNPVLVEYATRTREGHPRARALDIGCGAGRNAVPVARLGWTVLGTDLSQPMLAAALTRARAEPEHLAFGVAMAPMDRLPVADRSVDLIIAHGIWNLARSGAEMRRAMREAARVAGEGAALFVFTFSRHTLPATADPVVGETFVFTQFSGQPQCFLTGEQLVAELSGAGFVFDSAVPLTEYNRPGPTTLPSAGGPVIYEAAFRYRGATA